MVDDSISVGPEASESRDDTISVKQVASVDWIGAALITSGLLVLLFALTEGNIVGWSTLWVPCLIVVSIFIILAFVAWQWYLETKTTCPPIVKVSLFKNLRLSAAMVITMLSLAVLNNNLIYATFLYQKYENLSPLQTMLRFLPSSLPGIIVIVVVAQLLSRVPTLFILVAGTIAVSISCLLFAIPTPADTSYFASSMWALVLNTVASHISRGSSNRKRSHQRTWPAWESFGVGYLHRFANGGYG